MLPADDQTTLSFMQSNGSSAHGRSDCPLMRPAWISGLSQSVAVASHDAVLGFKAAYVT
jgi:hypothetical protein